MIGELGQVLLILALLAAAVQAVAGLGTAGQAAPRLVDTAAAWQAGAMAGAATLLALAFVQGDFSVAYVAQHSHSRLPVPYRVAAVWGGHEGSMLVWALALSAWTLAAGRSIGSHDRAYATRTLGMLGAVAAGAIGFILFTSNPFLRLLPAAAEGLSLNPLLQDPAMALHPPLLYAGYVGTAVPFAMVLAALWAPPPADWVRWMRPFVAVALALLSIGIALGSWWAYYELGWGGWWFWDPVENASLMPWLALAALLHVLPARVQQGRFAHWTALLAIAGFVLALLGTFLVRSGVLTSVHAFASDPRRGTAMLALIAAASAASLLLLARHAPRLLPPAAPRPAHPLSREGLLAMNNLLLAVACGCVLLGTLYPLALDALGLGKLSVGAPYFETVLAPLLLPALGLLLLAGAMRWRRDRPRRLARQLRPALWATGVAVLVLPCALLLAHGTVRALVLLALVGAAAATAGTLQALVQRVRLGTLGARAAGMGLAHAGVAVLAVGMAMVKGYGLERDVRLAPGDRHLVAGCELSFDALDRGSGPNWQAQVGRFTLHCPGDKPQAMVSEKRLYVGSSMPMTESAIDARIARDIYVALGSPQDGMAWGVRVQYKPFVRWIWAGVLLMAAGAGLAAGAGRRSAQPAARAVPDTAGVGTGSVSPAINGPGTIGLT